MQFDSARCCGSRCGIERRNQRSVQPEGCGLTRLSQDREESRADLAARFRAIQAVEIGNRGTQELRRPGVEKTTANPRKTL